MERRVSEVVARFTEQFGFPPTIASRAPGRVNLIGEHTDYNDGFVFPMALDCQITMAAAPRDDSTVRLASVNFGEEDSFSLESLAPTPSKPWSNYLRGVLNEFRLLGLPLTGFHALFMGDVPLGSGLSSSAALEVAAAMLIAELNALVVDRRELARLCQRAEQRFAGVSCGIMDQFIALLGEAGHALFLDCRSLEYDLVPVASDEYAFVVCNSNAPRTLAGSAYNVRRRECAEGVELLSGSLPGITSLRDVSMEDFTRVQDTLPDAVRRRCRHVIGENERVVEATTLLREGRLGEFGARMTASHRSLRDDYEVSSPALDALVEIALSLPGCIGARMTGAGFGGCTVSLVRRSLVEEFIAAVCERYPTVSGLQAECFVSMPCRGAEAWRL